MKIRLTNELGNREEQTLELRDVFAAFALAGNLQHQTAFLSPDRAAEWAYQHADAMLKARRKGAG
jgi:hypothetical protein